MRKWQGIAPGEAWEDVPAHWDTRTVGRFEMIGIV